MELEFSAGKAARFLCGFKNVYFVGYLITFTNSLIKVPFAFSMGLTYKEGFSTFLFYVGSILIF